MKPEERARLIDNIVDSLICVPPQIQARQIAHFIKADPDYGRGVERGLNAARMKALGCSEKELPESC